MTEIQAIHPWIFRRKPIPAPQLRLFCAPYAGRGASVYRGWPELMGSQVELCCLQLPGREGRLRERPFTRMQDAVRDAAQALQPYLDVPFAFFGHSMGALLCFELARRLRREYGAAPVHLFISARRAPQFPDRRPPLTPLRNQEFVAEMTRRYNAIPAEVLEDSELMDLLLPVLRADVEMLETYAYEPGPAFGCPITVFGGRDDTDTSLEELNGWRTHTSGRFQTTLFEGDHFFLHSAQKQVLAAISRQLNLS